MKKLCFRRIQILGCTVGLFDHRAACKPNQSGTFVVDWNHDPVAESVKKTAVFCTDGESTIDECFWVVTFR